MWHTDNEGIDFPGPAEALRALRLRARRAIDEGDRHGIDLRQRRIRVRTDSGEVLFEGTLEEAARVEMDGHAVLPPRPS
jgi:hypothetical protein